MRETRIWLFMQMERVACRSDFDWLIICYLFPLNNCPEAHCPPMLLPVPPDHIIKSEKISKMAAKGYFTIYP